MHPIVSAMRPALRLTLLAALLLAACAPAAPPSPTAPAAPKPAEAAKPAAEAKLAEAKPAAAKPAVAQKHLRLAINNPVLEPGIAFLWIGQALGYFEEEGLTVEIAPSQGAAEATQWVAAGRVDLAVPQGSAMVNAAAQGQDLGIVAAYLMNRQSIYEWVVLPDSPLQSLAELKGKKVGIESEGGEGTYIYRALMKELGQTPEANQVIVAGQALQAAENIKKGAVDVMIWADTSRALSQAQGYQWRQLPTPKYYEKIFANVAVTRKQFLTEQRATLVAYLRSLAKASLFFTTNPDAALRLHFKLHPQTVPTGVSVDDAVQRNLVGVNVRAPKLIPKAGERWGEFSKEAWEYYAREYLGHGDKIKDVTQFYTNDLLAEINSFDAQKIVEQAKNYKVQ